MLKKNNFIEIDDNLYDDIDIDDNKEIDLVDEEFAF